MAYLELPLEDKVYQLSTKIFWKDPYLTTLNTTVAAILGPEVILSETIFYAQSGGQESDSGTISGLPVLRARKIGQSQLLHGIASSESINESDTIEDLEIAYTLQPDHNLHVGDSVAIAIDWLRRYRLMRLHFAAEIILELVYQLYPGTAKVGAHIAEDKARIDFQWPENISVLFPQLLKSCSVIVNDDKPITSAYADEAAQRRYWEIAGFARVLCGGTHLKKTSEIGQLHLKRKNIGKGKERIEIFLVEPDLLP